MPNVYAKWAVHYGGTCNSEFEQSGYIAQFPPHLRGGCCMTLCCCWIAANGNMEAFKSFVNSGVGKAQVRGYQGLATKASKGASDLGGYFIGYINEVLKIFGVTFRGEVAMAESSRPAEVVTFVSNRPAFYQLHFQSANDSSGHAVAFRNTGTELSFFDPNYGTAVFSGKTRQRQLNNFASTVLGGHFYPELMGRWEAIRAYR
jgi:hypothetical protein